MPDNINVAQFKTFASEESAIGAETGIRRQVDLGKDQSQISEHRTCM